MSARPAVTVLMPVFNAAPYLAEAIDSILAQTEPDFELLLIDDGSTDSSLATACAYTDRRIRLVIGGSNRGVVARLNDGLNAARARYVARMDADDVMHPDRLRKQLVYMRDRPETGICGTWVLRASPDGRTEESRFPTEHAAIAAQLLFENAVAHPTVMLDMEALNRHDLRYAPTAAHVEDYDLWVRASRVLKLANLPGVLHRYRIHPASIGAVHGPVQSIGAQAVRGRALHGLGLTWTERDLAVHRILASATDLYDGATLDEVSAWAAKLKRHAGFWSAEGRAIRRECTERLGKIARRTAETRARP